MPSAINAGDNLYQNCIETCQSTAPACRCKGLPALDKPSHLAAATPTWLPPPCEMHQKFSRHARSRLSTAPKRDCRCQHHQWSAVAVVGWWVASVVVGAGRTGGCMPSYALRLHACWVRPACRVEWGGAGPSGPVLVQYWWMERVFVA